MCAGMQVIGRVNIKPNKLSSSTLLVTIIEMYSTEISYEGDAIGGHSQNLQLFSETQKTAR